MGCPCRCSPTAWHDAMTQETLDTLARVREMNRERYATIQTIRNTDTRRVGRTIMPVDESTKTFQIAQINRIYRQNANGVYNALNLDRLEAGLPMLENPFEKGTEK